MGVFGLFITHHHCAGLTARVIKKQAKACAPNVDNSTIFCQHLHVELIALFNAAYYILKQRDME